MAPSRKTKIAVGIVVTMSALALSPIVWDYWQFRRAQSRAQTIGIGDSKATVEAVLGKPTAIFPKGSGVLDGPLFGFSPERWAYGSDFDWKNSFSTEFPFFLPFRCRIFGPDEEDVAIEFDDLGFVAQVSVP